jgi:hypothetical protein
MKFIACWALAISLGLGISYADSVTIHNFTKDNFNYGYESWQDLGKSTEKTDDGIRLFGSAKGGAGLFFHKIIDASEATHLVIRMKKGADHSGKLIIRLMSADGKSAEWGIEPADISDTEVKEIELPFAKLSNQDVNFEELKGIQIQGTFSPSEKIDVVFENIAAVKKEDAPAEAAPAQATSSSS